MIAYTELTTKHIDSWVDDGRVLARTHAPLKPGIPLASLLPTSQVSGSTHIRNTAVRMTTAAIIKSLQKNASQGLCSVAVRVDPRIADLVAGEIRARVKQVHEISIDRYACRITGVAEDSQLHVSMCVFC